MSPTVHLVMVSTTTSSSISIYASLSLHDFLQSVVRREFDEDTGRVRLIKGDGEVLEECVSRLDHFD